MTGHRSKTARAVRTDAGRAATAVVFCLLLTAAVAIYLYARSRAGEHRSNPEPLPAVTTEAAAAGHQRLLALREGAERLMAEGRAAADRREFDAALEKLTTADKLLQELPPNPERDAQLTAIRDSLARLTRERDEARRREREEYFTRRFEEFRALAGDRAVEAWERAVPLGDDLLKDFPEKADKVQPTLSSLRRQIDAVDQSIRKRIREASEAAASGRFGAAFEQLNGARAWRAKDPRIDEASRVIRALIATLDLVRVPAGPFVAGSDAPADRNAPRRDAQTGEYLIDRFEVTNEQYHWFCSDTGHPAPPHWPGKRYTAERAAHPVTHVTCADTEAYAAWLGKRLPTEAEWEKAARGFDGRIFPWGNDVPKIPVCNAAPVVLPDGSAPEPDTVPVGSIRGGESPYGVADMAGNVWEWTSGTGPIEDPTVAASPTPGGNGLPTPAAVEGRVLRGGSFACGREGLRSARRYVESPDVWLRDAGFRCVKD